MTNTVLGKRTKRSLAELVYQISLDMTFGYWMLDMRKYQRLTGLSSYSQVLEGNIYFALEWNDISDMQRLSQGCNLYGEEFGNFSVFH